ncbi:hypothetical protein [Xylophilus ampelinus]|nr:hypothetical protein [Xylophilus ampelinus]MCS4509289.1 hypothetical protein [Xylophilus ampelinus]
MSIEETIKAATAVVGSQRELAAILGIPETHISGYKKGRPYSYQRHAEIAAIAGLEEEATRILLEGIAAGMRDDLPHEAHAKAGIRAMLDAFPPPKEALSKSKPKARK